MHILLFNLRPVCWITSVCCLLCNIPTNQLVAEAGIILSADTPAPFDIESSTWRSTEVNLSDNDFLTDFTEIQLSNKSQDLRITEVLKSTSEDITVSSVSTTENAANTISLTDIIKNFIYGSNSTISTNENSSRSSTANFSSTSSPTNFSTESVTGFYRINSPSDLVTNYTTYFNSTSSPADLITNSTIYFSNTSSPADLSTTSATYSTSGLSSSTINKILAIDVSGTFTNETQIEKFTNHISISSSAAFISSTSFTTNSITTEHLKVKDNTVEPERGYNAFDYELEESDAPQCGQIFSRYPRIIGGVDSLAGEFPWAVSVRVLTTHYCGGTIINKDWVLTAAHCVKRFAARYFRVRLGGHDVDVDKYRPQWDIQVSEVVVHPQFGSPARYSYDVALLRLRRSIDYNEFAAPVCLPENLNESYEGWNVTVVGWGRHQELIESKASILQKAVIPVVNNNICAEWYSKVHYGYIRVRDFQICAGEREGGKDSCKGDSGGPLVVMNQKGRYTLVGVVSAGVGCGRSRLPGIYSRVSYFVPWIEKITGGYTQWPISPPKQQKTQKI